MSAEQKHKLILHIEVPDIYSDDLTADYCATALDGEYTPEEQFAASFDENVVVSLLVQSAGEDGPRVLGHEGLIVGFDVVPR